MAIIKTSIQDLLVIEPEIHEDKRGFFFESYNKSIFNNEGIQVEFVQDNQSKSTYGVLRGLHYQLNPFAQAKLVSVLRGEVYDVSVDIRKGSPSYGKWFGVALSGDNKKQVFIPKGFAHGFIVLSDTAEFFYKCDNYYSPDHEAGIVFDDKELNIDWQFDSEKMTISQRDKELPSFEQATNNFTY